MSDKGKKIQVRCAFCETPFDKPLKEYRRSEKVGRRHLCSRSCSVRLANREIRRIGRPENLKADNQHDDYTPFRWYMARARYRSDKKGETDLTVEYLKEVWDQQGGRCPFTDWELALPASTAGKWHEGRCSRRASLDRIDNSKGYVKGNVRFVSAMANVARGRSTDEEMIEFCMAVTKGRG